MRLTVFSDGCRTGQCVPSAMTSHPSDPGTILLNFSLVLHTAISFETFLAVGSTAASILSVTLRYLHMLVGSIPNIICSVPCVGLSFLRISVMNRVCRRCSLYLLSGSDARDSSSQNSGMSPDAVAYASFCPEIYWNFSLPYRVAEHTLDT